MFKANAGGVDDGVVGVAYGFDIPAVSEGDRSAGREKFPHTDAENEPPLVLAQKIGFLMNDVCAVK